MSSKTKQIVILLAIVTILIPVIIFAGQTGKIRGIITDKVTGQPIAGASVLVVGTSLGAMTDQDGKFLITMIKPGKYNLRVTTIGYDSYEIDSIKVVIDITTVQNFELSKSVTDLDKIIRITAEPKNIDKYVHGSRTSISKKEIECLPVQNVDELLQQTAGVVTTDEGNIVIRGGRAGEIAYIVDGVRVGDPLGGYNQKKCKPVVPPAHGGTNIVNGEPYDAMFFKSYGTNPFVDTEDDHLSTFAIDTDDASFVMARSYLERGNLPPDEAIRVEEFVNHFNYDYKPPRNEPFRVYTEGGPSEFGQNCQLLKIGIKGRQIDPEDRKPANLIFVIDVSGSMNREDRLELVKRALRMLVDELNESDNVGIVVYGSRGDVILNPTSIRYREEILSAIDRLRPAGSTNADEGLKLGYQMANRYFEENKTNRIILCSDGVANVGLTNADDLLERIKKSANKGITLSAIGFGMGNYNDILMEKLGNKGNGYYAYVDDIKEAHRIFVENLTGSLEVIARDVKIQVDFDPEIVRSYRLLGYENRDVADNKFRDDKEDGGEIGSGHEVTALYEIKFHKNSDWGHIGDIYIRYKNPESFDVDEILVPIRRRVFENRFGQCSDQFKLAALSAEFAEILKKSYWAKGSQLDDLKFLIKKNFRHTNSHEVIELKQLISRATKFQEQLAEK
ncbi:MAG: DUF3520 domain-containing protein [candidate division Zixibacteria bacterium]|nr:DUF3520 domain-containing protein [candidate division Zixibacteria bacterium]